MLQNTGKREALSPQFNKTNTEREDTMSFSRTELGNAFKLLSERLPEFSERQAHATRLLHITSDRLSSQQNELLKALLEKESTSEISVSSISQAISRVNQRNGKTIIPIGT